MDYRKKLFYSDRPSEDKGYSRSHRQTKGGMQAYNRGEMPLSYWKKEILIKRIEALLNATKRDTKYAKKYKDFISYMGMSTEEIIEQLKKVKLQLLKDNLLEDKGVHYTGNYYRYTRFYGLVPQVTLMNRIKFRGFISPRIVQQLKLAL